VEGLLAAEVAAAVAAADQERQPDEKRAAIRLPSTANRPTIMIDQWRDNLADNERSPAVRYHHGVRADACCGRSGEG
jgi:hypothetical protein